MLTEVHPGQDDGVFHVNMEPVHKLSLMILLIPLTLWTVQVTDDVHHSDPSGPPLAWLTVRT